MRMVVGMCMGNCCVCVCVFLWVLSFVSVVPAGLWMDMGVRLRLVVVKIWLVGKGKDRGTRKGDRSPGRGGVLGSWLGGRKGGGRVRWGRFC